MRWVLLLAEADPEAWDRAGEAEREEVYAAHRAFDAAVRARGSLVSGEALTGAATACTLRTVAGARVVTDGPFAETAEQLTGVYVVDLPSQEVALEVASLLPAGYTVELRPVLDLGDY